MRLPLFLLLAVIVSGVLAGSNPMDQTVVNILLGEGYTQEQINEIMALPQFPVFDRNNKLVGDQTVYGPNNRWLVIYSFDTGRCYTTTTLYDYTGEK